MTNLTPVLTALVTLSVAVLTVFVIPWIKTKTSAQDMEQLLKWVEVAVMAAQQLYHSADGPRRLEYALEFLAGKGYNVDEPAVRNAIEAAVLKLHQSMLEPAYIVPESGTRGGVCDG